MAINTGGMAQGMLDAMAAQRQNALTDQQMAAERQRQQILMLQLQQTRAAQARQQQINQYAGMAIPPPEAPQAPQTPMPGQPSVPMVQGSPAPGAPPAAPKPAIPPYQTVQGLQSQQTPPAAPQGGPPPLSAPTNPLAGPGYVETAIANLKKANVPQELWGDIIEKNMPIYQAQEKEKLDRFNAEQAARRAADDAYHQSLMNQNIISEKEYRDWQMAHPTQSRVPQDPEALPVGFDQKDIDFYALRGLAGDYSWRTGLARSKNGSQIITSVDARQPKLARELGISAGQAATIHDVRAAVSKALSTRTTGLSAAKQFSKGFDKQADLVTGYLDKGAASADPIINRWIQSGRKAIAGDPDVTAFDAAIRGLAREHQRVISGAMGGAAQLPVAAQRTADELLSRDMTVDQIKATVDEMKSEVTNFTDSAESEVGNLKAQLVNLANFKSADKSSSQTNEQKPTVSNW